MSFHQPKPNDPHMISSAPNLLVLSLIRQGMSCVSHGRSGSQRGGDHRGLNHLGVGCACLARVATVDVDAVRALRRESHSHGNQLLVLHRNRSIRDGRLVESPKGLHHLGREAVHFLQLSQVFMVIHMFDKF